MHVRNDRNKVKVGWMNDEGAWYRRNEHGVGEMG